MQYVLALIGGGLLLLILMLVPMGLSIIQKTCVAGIASALSLLLLIFKIVYPLPLAILLVLLCAFVLMYVIWKKANFLFINVNDETMAMSIEHEPIVEVKNSFRNNLVKEIKDYDDNSREKEIVSPERSLQEEEKTIDDFELNHELLLKLEEVEEGPEPESDAIKPASEVLVEEDIDSIEELNFYSADRDDDEQSLEELSELEEIEEIDFTARMETTYEQEEEEEEDDSYFDDFIREAEQEQLQSRYEIETPDAPFIERDSKDSMRDKENLFENRIEMIANSVDRESTNDIKENEMTTEDRIAKQDEEQRESGEVDEPILLEDELDQMLELVEKEEQVEIDLESENEFTEDYSSKQVATQMLTLLHEQAQHYKSTGFELEYEKIVNQLLSSDLDDVMYFSIAAEYRSHLVESGQWEKVETLLFEMESRCKYPLLLEEIRYVRSIVKNKIMK
ncbi:hypothetical protein [Guptibacillus hwajinpoensis]|uniref:Uncharacterized protein YfcZ (UPF0381/DUF406 family) n=1 Tax=Guptibacillus hwajinpoensis TaxID=208199 RepID=A0ABU0JZW6_9BACL|nr:hypothetical protein [Alkalihalobacillus hemicentroti]MDQ0481422.1 uncharacterized protein YfcZ (UPF0381/DUF406 family) [Alkalihalobacillus hemicentroti]